MVNFFERVLQHPQYYRQFNCGKSHITAFNCPMEARLMKTRFADLWTNYNYLFYVIDGRKIWHTAQGTYDIQKDSCVFVRKGVYPGTTIGYRILRDVVFYTGRIYLRHPAYKIKTLIEI
jgi:AraC family transcriptional regulator, exoenzyme S synthesis regulatory protein ExsA